MCRTRYGHETGKKEKQKHGREQNSLPQDWGRESQNQAQRSYRETNNQLLGSLVKQSPFC